MFGRRKSEGGERRRDGDERFKRVAQVRRTREPATFGLYPFWPAPILCQVVGLVLLIRAGEELSTPTEIVTHAHDVAPGSAGKPERGMTRRCRWWLRSSESDEK